MVDGLTGENGQGKTFNNVEILANDSLFIFIEATADILDANPVDFTYIDNVIQMNELAMLTENPEAINTVYNTAFGERTTLNELVNSLKEFLSAYDKEIANVPIVYGENRVGDIPHSLASIEKASKLLNYQPQFSMKEGLKEAVKWYWNNLQEKSKK